MKKIDIDGDIFYLDELYGYLHNEDGPAIILKNGMEWWIKKGRLHKENGEAIDRPEKKEKIFNEYWINGKIANEDEIKNIKRNKWIDKAL